MLETAFVDRLLQLYDNHACIFISSPNYGGDAAQHIYHLIKYDVTAIYNLSLNEDDQVHHCIFFSTQDNALSAHARFSWALSSKPGCLLHSLGTRHLPDFWKQQLLFTQAQVVDNPQLDQIIGVHPQNLRIFWSIDVEHLREAAKRLQNSMSPQDIPLPPSSSSSTSSFVTAPEPALAEETPVLSPPSPTFEAETPPMDLDTKYANATEIIDLIFEEDAVITKDGIDFDGVHYEYHHYPEDPDSAEFDEDFILLEEDIEKIQDRCNQYDNYQDKQRAFDEEWIRVFNRMAAESLGVSPAKGTGKRFVL